MTTPHLVALDIDGTLLKWIDGGTSSHEEVSQQVHDAVRRVLAAGAHVVLASGRSPHSMTDVADLLGLPEAAETAGDRLWVVASNPTRVCPSAVRWRTARPAPWAWSVATHSSSCTGRLRGTVRSTSTTGVGRPPSQRTRSSPARPPVSAVTRRPTTPASTPAT